MSPKIAASSVKEHHAMMFQKLVDAAELVLRNEGPAALTAGVVAEAAGIARNSIYRYVDSVDDLRVLVLERYIPAWGERLESALAAADSPIGRLRRLVSLTLDIGAESGHQWLIDVIAAGGGRKMSGERPPAHVIKGKSGAVMNFHQELARNIAALWGQIVPERTLINTQITRSTLDAGLKLLDAGQDLAEVKDAALRVIDALAAHGGAAGNIR